MNNIFIIIVIATFIVLTLVALTSRRKIKTRFLKAVYGKFSYKYVNYFKTITTKSPYAMGVKDEIENHYKHFVGKLEGAPLFQTATPIAFSKEPFGVDEESFVKRKGEPNTYNVYMIGEHEELRVFGYEDFVEDQEIRTQFYFLNSEFFLGELVIKQEQIKNALAISTQLQEKYLGEVKLTKNRPFLIEDSSHGKIFFEDNGFNASVRYFSCQNNAITTALERSLKIDNSPATEQEVHEEESLASLL